MKNCNAGTPKSSTPKKTPPTNKQSPADTTPKSNDQKRTTSSQTKTLESCSESKSLGLLTLYPSRPGLADSNPDPPAKDTYDSGGSAQGTPGFKVKPQTKKVVKKVIRKVKVLKASSTQKPNSEEVLKPYVEECPNKSAEEHTDKRDTPIEYEEPFSVTLEQSIIANAEKSMRIEEDYIVENTVKNVKEIKMDEEREDTKVDENDGQIEFDEDTEELHIESTEMEDVNKLGSEYEKPEDDYHGDQGEEEYSLQNVINEPVEEDLVEDDMAEPIDESEPLEGEHMEAMEHAKQRMIKKELEIFVGGLSRDASEDDVKKAYGNVGEVVEVRLHMNPGTNKNKGYAFVRFANKDQVNRALSEMRNPVICGKRCGAAQSEDNDTLFLGNICNTWTKEAIKQKLMDYAIEGVENITLVSDPRYEGLSRGFAFLEFSCHTDAMHGYKRLQKPDVIFGHAERTAKVAFAEPLRDPDPTIMANVKSIFVDGLPPHWDEDRVRDHLKGYGEIIKVVLARNMSSAKRNDFGFVDFKTHEAAVACSNGINNSDLVDGNSKIKVRARLANPLPKTQAVKGGMCGGFRIGGSGGFSQQNGRNFVRGRSFSRGYFQHGRGFYPPERGQPDRMGFISEQNFDDPYSQHHGREFYAPGRRGGRGGSGPFRPNINRPHGPDRRDFFYRGSSFSPERVYGRHFVDRQFDDHVYDDGPRGSKRPLYMADLDPDFLEDSRRRPRIDYSDSAVSFRENRFHDTFGSGSGHYSRDCYGSDYEVAHPSFYGADRPYYGADHRYHEADQLYHGTYRQYRGGYY